MVPVWELCSETAHLNTSASGIFTPGEEAKPSKPNLDLGFILHKNGKGGDQNGNLHQNITMTTSSCEKKFCQTAERGKLDICGDFPKYQKSKKNLQNILIIKCSKQSIYEKDSERNGYGNLSKCKNNIVDDMCRNVHLTGSGKRYAFTTDGQKCRKSKDRDKNDRHKYNRRRSHRSRSHYYYPIENMGDEQSELNKSGSHNGQGAPQKKSRLQTNFTSPRYFHDRTGDSRLSDANRGDDGVRVRFSAEADKRQDKTESAGPRLEHVRSRRRQSDGYVSNVGRKGMMMSTSPQHHRRLPGDPSIRPDPQTLLGLTENAAVQPSSGRLALNTCKGGQSVEDVAAQDASFNRSGDYLLDTSDVSNNRLRWFGKKEDPRVTENRFYGGLSSARLAKIEQHRPHPGPDRFHRSRHRGIQAGSPSSTGVGSPTSVGGGVVSPTPLPGHEVLGVSTDDPVTGRNLVDKRPFPKGTFKAVSVLLEAPETRSGAPLPVFVTPHDRAPLGTRLQPYVPFDTLRPEVGSPLDTKLSLADNTDKQDDTVRHPPIQFQPKPESDAKGPLPQPFHHPGIVWPLAFASTPPYVTPGHDVGGVKQPVGVVQTGCVPSRPLHSRAWELETDLPAWISPLYKTYGVGGPYGRHGPFAEPALLAAGAPWSDLIRRVEAIGALNVPGVLADNGRVDLTGLCGDYIRLNKRTAPPKGGACKPCNAVKNFFSKVMVKMGLKSKTEDTKQKTEESTGGAATTEKKASSTANVAAPDGTGGEAAQVGDTADKVEADKEDKKASVDSENTEQDANQDKKEPEE